MFIINENDDKLYRIGLCVHFFARSGSCLFVCLFIVCLISYYANSQDLTTRLFICGFQKYASKIRAKHLSLQMNARENRELVVSFSKLNVLSFFTTHCQQSQRNTTGGSVASFRMSQNLVLMQRVIL